VEILVEEGMTVEVGQVLARLDSANVEKNLALMEARLNSARKALGETQANLEQAEREVRRVENLSARNAASQVELDRVRTEMNALSARLERQTADIAVSEGEVALWRQELDDTIIRAPFGGVVTSKDAQPGEMISPISAGGGFTRTGVCTIVDMSSLEIEVDVSESYINRVTPDQPVLATLDSYPDWQIPAKVIAIIPTADRQKATVKVRVGFEQLDERILPDMSVKVAFQSTGRTSAAQRSLTIPKAAVRQRDGRDIVWIVRDGHVERRAVTVGPGLGDDIAIAAGISSGERVVIEGPENLTEGMNVTEATP
jgi:HlyD family secretion protein